MDYWLGVLTDTQQEPIEEHLMGCAVVVTGFATLSLTGSPRTLARSGSLLVVISDQLMTRAEEASAGPTNGASKCFE
jgi:hypothetical protein